MDRIEAVRTFHADACFDGSFAKISKLQTEQRMTRTFHQDS